MTLEAGRMRLIESGFQIDYLELIDGRALTPLAALRKNARVAAAVRLGRVRLIDNVALFTG